MHAEFQWGNPFQILAHLPFFEFHPVSYNTVIQKPSFTGQRFILILLQKTFTLHKAQSRKWRSSGMWHCEGWYKSTNIWRHSTIIRLKSQNLHHLPCTSFTSGILYASSCCELEMVYDKRFLWMKNTIHYMCYGDSIHIKIYGVFHEYERQARHLEADWEVSCDMPQLWFPFIWVIFLSWVTCVHVLYNKK
jgi:hypothetical protein